MNDYPGTFLRTNINTMTFLYLKSLTLVNEIGVRDRSPYPEPQCMTLSLKGPRDPAEPRTTGAKCGQLGHISTRAASYNLMDFPTLPIK